MPVALLHKIKNSRYEKGWLLLCFVINGRTAQLQLKMCGLPAAEWQHISQELDSFAVCTRSSSRWESLSTPDSVASG